MKQKPIVVIGEGWAALAAVGFSLRQGKAVRWIGASATRMSPALPSLEAGIGAEAWKRLAAEFGIDAGELENGAFQREFRNKAFREALWTKAPTPELRREVREEYLWQPERGLASLFESRFAMSVFEIEEALRAQLTSENFPTLKRIDGIPVSGFKIEDHEVQAVLLASGEELECESVIYADRWNLLSGLSGLPKLLPFTRKREAMGVLQAVFGHPQAVGTGVREGFFGMLHKEAGEEMDRHVWGYFTSDGKKSIWTVCLAENEVEDNHAIAKKLRRLKAALDKMFTGTEWVPEGKGEFLANIGDEQVRFAEAVLFSEGEVPSAPFQIAAAKNLQFITDGYGPSSALHQAALACGVELIPAERPDAEAEGVHPERAAEL